MSDNPTIPIKLLRIAELDYIDEIFDEICGNTNRSVSILAAAHVDVLLGSILELRMVETTNREDPLLSANQPLYFLGPRTQAAYRLGCITLDLFRAINILRSMRNDFAHDSKPQSFNDPHHASRIREIHKFYDNDRINNRISKFTKHTDNNTATFFICYVMGIHADLLQCKSKITRIEEYVDTLDAP